MWNQIQVKENFCVLNSLLLFRSTFWQYCWKHVSEIKTRYLTKSRKIKTCFVHDRVLSNVSSTREGINVTYQDEAVTSALGLKPLSQIFFTIYHLDFATLIFENLYTNKKLSNYDCFLASCCRCCLTASVTSWHVLAVQSDSATQSVTYNYHQSHSNFGSIHITRPKYE